MKVLILHQHFKTPQPGGAIRSYYLAKALVEKGICTVVITAHNGPSIKKEVLEGIEILYLPVRYDNRYGFSKRILSFLRFVVQSVRMASHYRDANLCYAISTPLTTGMAARFIRRYFGIPYIFEVGDLWPDAPVQMGFVSNTFIKNILYRMEKAIYRSASSVVALSIPIREAIVAKAPEKTVHVVPNMSDLDFFKPKEKRSAFEEKFEVKGKFVVSYIGAFGVANGLYYFLDCAAACQRAALPIHFILCGDGAMVNALKRYGEKLVLNNFSLIPFQNRDGVAAILNVTDANFICYQPANILETGSPNKYFDGLAAAKLTIINFGGWIKEEIEKEACGFSVDPIDAEDFVRKIRPFLHDHQLLTAYQCAGRKLAEREYSRKMLAERFVGIVEREIQDTETP